MQRKHLWLLNVVLAGFAVLLGNRLAGGWRQDQARYAALEKRGAAAAAPLVLPAAASLTAIGGDVVARNPFSQDRNNDRPQPVQTAAQNAPLPVVIGTMQLGGDYEALMSEGGHPGAEKFRRLKSGASIGPYTIAEIRDEAVVVELGGQKTTLNVYQSAKAVRQTTAGSIVAPTAAVAPAAQAPVVVSTGVPQPSQPPAPAQSGNTSATSRGVDLTPPFPGVTVTIEGNRKRFERFTAFGPQVWYEDIK